LIDGEEVTAPGPPKTGSYEELNPPDLPLVKEKMDVTICVSPEAGCLLLDVSSVTLNGITATTTAGTGAPAGG
jgi:hypothetical protein